MKRSGVPFALKREVFHRDHHACLKCRSRKKLECHHIVAVVFGGVDAVSNLITLCKKCHKEAPNDPSDTFRWLATALPPNLDISKILTKMCVSLLLHREGLNEKIKPAEQFVDDAYADMWKVSLAVERDRVGPEAEEGFEVFGNFTRKYFAPPESVVS